MAESRGPTVDGVAIAFAILTAIVISLRLCARAFIVKSVGVDDVLICVAALLSWAFIIVTIMAVSHGLGSHIQDVLPRGTDNMIAYSQVVWLSSIFYNACLGFVKLSVLALYMRLGDRSLQRLAVGMAAVVSCQAGGNALACIFQCSPVRAAYDLRVPAADKRCIDINAFYLANAAANIFTDILTYTLPVRMVLKLQIPRRQKAGLGVMLGLGLFACISSIIRITYIPQMLVSAVATWAITGAMYWSVIETNVGILAASIPSYKALAKRYAPRLLLGGASYERASGKRSGFRMVSVGRSGRRDGDGDGDAGTDGDGSVGGGVHQHGEAHALGTRVDPGIDGNSSEEALYPPAGRIGVKTEVKTHYTEA